MCDMRTFVDKQSSRLLHTVSRVYDTASAQLAICVETSNIERTLFLVILNCGYIYNCCTAFLARICRYWLKKTNETGNVALTLFGQIDHDYTVIMHC